MPAACPETKTGPAENIPGIFPGPEKNKYPVGVPFFYDHEKKTDRKTGPGKRAGGKHTRRGTPILKIGPGRSFHHIPQEKSPSTY